MASNIILLDTNSYSAFISGNKTVSRFVLKANSICMSSIVLGELYAGFIREGIFENISDEIPYESDVIIDKIYEEANIDKIFATIIIEKESQKGIIIGKNGESIKRIGKYSREKIETLSGKKVYLDLQVVVKKGWTKDKSFLEKIGYTS